MSDPPAAGHPNRGDQVSSAIRMMMGSGTPRSQSSKAPMVVSS